MQEAKNKSKIESFALGAVLGITILVFLGAAAFTIFERSYAGRIYPNVTVGGVLFGGKTPREVKEYWLSQNEPFTSKTFEFRYRDEVATISAIDLDLGYDATLSATQAFLVGRSKHFFSDFYTKFIKKNTDLTPYFRWDTQTLEETLTLLAQRLDIPVQDALFSFRGGRVTAFRPSRSGRRLNVDLTKKRWQDILPNIPKIPEKTVTIEVPVETIEPSITTDQVNTFGIKELLGRGYSEFTGSIP